MPIPPNRRAGVIQSARARYIVAVAQASGQAQEPWNRTPQHYRDGWSRRCDSIHDNAQAADEYPSAITAVNDALNE